MIYKVIYSEFNKFSRKMKTTCVFETTDKREACRAFDRYRKAFDRYRKKTNGVTNGVYIEEQEG